MKTNLIMKQIILNLKKCKRNKRRLVVVRKHNHQTNQNNLEWEVIMTNKNDTGFQTCSTLFYYNALKI